MPIEKETEEKIFKAAQSVFQRRGFDGARMQEIADEAEINKSMLHYYYRSKDKLFHEVFQAGVKKVMPRLIGIIASDSPLKEKVHQVVDFYHDLFQENLHLPAFVTYEMNQHPERFQEFMKHMNIQVPAVFENQIREEIDAGRMIDIPPRQFLINIVSLCMMPVVAKKMVQIIFHLDESSYADFLEERRALIPTLIFNGVKPQ